MHYLNAYKPLIATKHGRVAVSTYGLPPFVDGSCRREPDFESQFPSISTVCRRMKFAPRLCEGDVVVYVTKKGRYLQSMQGHWRLVAILKVLKHFESHADAAEWYKSRGVELPSNCLVKSNPPLPLEKTTGDRNLLSQWDAIYQFRTRECGVFLVCEPEFVELYQPPILTEDMMLDIFGRIPGLRNPPKIPAVEFEKLRWIAQG
jgi:hypothetical protein